MSSGWRVSDRLESGGATRKGSYWEETKETVPVLDIISGREVRTGPLNPDTV